MGGVVTHFFIGVPSLNLLGGLKSFPKFFNSFQHKITYRQGVPQPRILANISSRIRLNKAHPNRGQTIKDKPRNFRTLKLFKLV